MVVDLARATAAAGAQQFLVVSAIGANEHALAFYSRVKGRMEKTVSALTFAAGHIFQPSLLLGERREHRSGEAVAPKLSPMTSPIQPGPFRTHPPGAAAREHGKASCRGRR